MRASHALEPDNQGLEGRARVARLLPDEAALLRLNRAPLAEAGVDRDSGKAHLGMANPPPPSV